MSTPKEKKNPWDALFTSVTRPIPPANNNALARGYIISIHHSISSAAQRAHALSATLNSTNVTTSLASMNISKSSSKTYQGEWFGMAGSFLVRNSFDELSIRCEGALVFVSLLGTSGVVECESFLDKVDVFDHDTLENVEHKEISKRRNALKMFRKNGVIVDLASNPFGWDDTTKDDSEDVIVTSSIDSLQSVADAIYAAAARVCSPQSCDAQRPIPIIFDSLTPLLSLHGAQNVALLLRRFKCLKPHSSPLILSPIIVPILYESISPPDHRLIEDISDAFISLHLRDDTNRDHAIARGVLDLIRRGGVGSGLGGKLMRGRVPVHIMKARESTMNEYSVNVRDGCYWILEYSDDETINAGEEIQNVEQHVGVPKATSRKGIYLENDDPDFDDFDEEDPDDDIDL